MMSFQCWSTMKHYRHTATIWIIIIDWMSRERSATWNKSVRSIHTSVWHSSLCSCFHRSVSRSPANVLPFPSIITELWMKIHWLNICSPQRILIVIGWLNIPSFWQKTGRAWPMSIPWATLDDLLGSLMKIIFSLQWFKESCSIAFLCLIRES